MAEMPTLTSRKQGGFKQNIGRFSKLHATSMAQNLPEIGRLLNLGVQMDNFEKKKKRGASL